jgi:hypothetical protein
MMRRAIPIALGAVLSTACAVVLGIDQDYHAENVDAGSGGASGAATGGASGAAAGSGMAGASSGGASSGGTSSGGNDAGSDAAGSSGSSGAGGAATCPGNLVENPGFDSNLGFWKLKSATQTWLDGGGIDGGGAARVCFSGGSEGSYYIHQDLLSPPPQGQTYVVSVQARSETPHAIRAFLQERDSTGTQKPCAGNGADSVLGPNFEEISGKYTTLGTCNGVDPSILRVYIEGRGFDAGAPCFDLDEVCVYAVP